MNRLLTILIMIASVGPIMKAQGFSDMDAIMAFLGSDDLMELDPDDVEKLEHFLVEPIRLNTASESQLRSCGLFSAYQTAVISDYISCHGPVRSMVEFSLLDGFGEDFVRKVAPFVDLESEKAVTAAPGNAVKHDITAKGSLICREDEGYDGTYGLKFRVDSHGKFTAAIAASRTSGARSWAPSAYSGSFAWKFRRIPLRITVGDFYARFGQGLVLWSSSLISGLTSPDSFMKKPSGITQPWSFTGGNAMTGLAADYEWRQLKVSVIADVPDMKTAFNIAWYGRNGQVSFTNLVDAPQSGQEDAMALVTGLDAAFCVHGVNIFGEIAYDWMNHVPDILAGTRFKVGDPTDIAVQVRAFMNEQYGIAFSGVHTLRKNTLLWVTDAISNASGLQVKGLIAYEHSFSEYWKVKLRLSERFRTWGQPLRTDARADLAYAGSVWNASIRLNVLNCDKTAFLSYVEGGCKGDMLTAYLRQGIFFIDDWDDRIYVYERDAPSSFNVPAMYGRGVWTSLTASWKATSLLKVYVRGSVTGYPFMEKKKPGKAELKLQLQYRF